MNALIVKILAVGLTLSQIFTRTPEQFKPNFDPVADQAEVTAILHDGCGYVSTQFGLGADMEGLLFVLAANAKKLKEKAAAEATNTSGTDTNAKDGKPPGPQTLTQKLIAQLDMDALLAAYKQFCKGETLENSPLKMDEVVAFYNSAMKDLPDAAKLKGLHLPESTTLLDRSGQRFSEIYSDNARRHFVSIKELPDYIKQAFVSAEDKRFFQHPGVDIPGVVRAFSSGFTSSGRQQGGSTITQQVVKNLLVGDDLTFERKMREMIMASRVEKILSKDEILELYINYIFLGRASWGIEMASQSYFKKHAKQLTLGEAAMIAGLTKGPNYYNPDRYPDRVMERRQYVLGRMKEDGYITDEQLKTASAEKIAPIPFESPRARAAFYYIDQIQREAKQRAKIPSLTSGSYVIKSTIHPALQKVAEEALEDGLAAYETAAGRAEWTGPVGNINDSLNKYHSTWKEILPRVHSKYYDIHWPLAVVTSLGVRKSLKNKKGKTYYVMSGFNVGLVDGREIPLGGSANVLATLKVNDLVHVKIDEDKGTAMLQIPPHVQGAVVVLEAKTGRVLSMVGGFSYADSQLNRVTQSAFQPGSALKPFIHLSALNLGYQPDTLIPNTAFTLPPIARGGHSWSPGNYDGRGHGLVSIRQTIEQSLNIPTGRIMASMANTPTEGLDYIEGIAQELGIYKHPIRVYPFVLGAQPARLIDMATAYATIVNIAATPNSVCPMCMKPVPYFIDSIDQDGKRIYSPPRFDLQPVNSLDRVAIYQIRRIMEGTVARGTAVKMKDLTGYVGGKTGTSNNWKDAWFVCFTNDLVIATWVGYDNTHIKPNLGRGFTGGKVALPIGEAILRKSFDIYAPKQLLSGPPADIRNLVVDYPIAGSHNLSFEALRVGPNGPMNTRNAILRGNEVGMSMEYPPSEEDNSADLEPQSENDSDYSYGPEQDYGNDPGYVPVQPGAEDDFDLWQSRGRQVDPMYLQPSFFNQ